MIPKTPPEELSERELFNQYVKLLDQHESPINGYGAIKRHKHQAKLLTEIGERLETLEATKSLIQNRGRSDNQRPQQLNEQLIGTER